MQPSLIPTVELLPEASKLAVNNVCVITCIAWLRSMFESVFVKNKRSTDNQNQQGKALDF
eukprot:6120426-Amphidinium_carterae.1